MNGKTSGIKSSGRYYVNDRRDEKRFFGRRDASVLQHAAEKPDHVRKEHRENSSFDLSVQTFRGVSVLFVGFFIVVQSDFSSVENR